MKRSKLRPVNCGASNAEGIGMCPGNIFSLERKLLTASTSLFVTALLPRLGSVIVAVCFFLPEILLDWATILGSCCPAAILGPAVMATLTWRGEPIGESGLV